MSHLAETAGLIGGASPKTTSGCRTGFLDIALAMLAWMPVTASWRNMPFSYHTVSVLAGHWFCAILQASPSSCHNTAVGSCSAACPFQKSCF
jgi:hypothetical protein